jgi:hypothetical protein
VIISHYNSQNTSCSFQIHSYDIQSFGNVILLDELSQLVSFSSIVEGNRAHDLVTDPVSIRSVLNTPRRMNLLLLILKSIHLSPTLENHSLATSSLEGLLLSRVVVLL